MGSASNKHEQLFRQYVEVCNRALEANKDKFPYKQLWDVTQAVMKDETIPVAIYDDQPKATYALRFKDHHIDADAVEQELEEHPWHLNTSYLEEVVSHPDDYINNPAKIDWDWLCNRLRG